MKLRSTLVLAAPIAACLAVSAHAAPPPAAPKPLVLTDLAGDANAANDQGLVSGTPVPAGTATGPATVAQFDIKSVTVAATGAMATRKVGKKKIKYFNCTGYTATLELAGAPLSNGALYRIQGSATSHDTYWLQYAVDAAGTATTVLRYTDEAATLGTSTIAIAPAKIDGTKITFTVTGANMKASGESLGKTILSGFGADVRTNGQIPGVGGATAPMWDQLPIDDATAWKVCPQ